MWSRTHFVRGRKSQCVQPDARYTTIRAAPAPTTRRPCCACPPGRYSSSHQPQSARPPSPWQTLWPSQAPLSGIRSDSDQTRYAFCPSIAVSTITQFDGSAIGDWEGRRARPGGAPPKGGRRWRKDTMGDGVRRAGRDHCARLAGWVNSQTTSVSLRSRSSMARSPLEYRLSVRPVRGLATLRTASLD